MLQPFPYARLERLDPAEAELFFGLSRGRRTWLAIGHVLERLLPIRLAAEVVQVACAAVGNADDDLGAGWTAGLVAASGEVVGYLRVDGPLGQVLAGAVLSGAAPPDVEVRPLLPSETACLEVLLAHVVARVGASVEVRSAPCLDLRRLGGPGIGRVVVRVQTREVSGWVSMWLNPSAWQRVTAPTGGPAGALLERLRMRPEWGSIEREVRIGLGFFGSLQSQLLALEPGDVLMPAAWRDRPALPGVLRLESVEVARLEVRPGPPLELGVTAVAPTHEDVMSDRKTSSPETHTAKTLRKMKPVIRERRESLELVIGGTTLTLAEVLELHPGMVLTLDEALDAPVELVLDGRTVGRGELVEVEGRLGVCILSIAK